MIILLIVAVLLLIFNALSVTAESIYNEKKFTLKLKIGKLLIFESGKKKKKKTGADEEEKPEEKKAAGKLSINSPKELIKDVLSILKYIPGKIKSRELIADIKYSSGDAAVTGETCGAFWAAVGAVFPAAVTILDFKKTPEINFTPLFEEKCLEIYYKGIFSLRIYHIFILGVLILFKFKKYIKFKAVD